MTFIHSHSYSDEGATSCPPGLSKPFMHCRDSLREPSGLKQCTVCIRINNTGLNLVTKTKELIKGYQKISIYFFPSPIQTPIQTLHCTEEAHICLLITWFGYLLSARVMKLHCNLCFYVLFSLKPQGGHESCEQVWSKFTTSSKNQKSVPAWEDKCVLSIWVILMGRNNNNDWLLQW